MLTYLTHAQLVLPDEVLDDASLLIGDGRIAAINPTVPPDADIIDLGGAYLLPGLIDLHCDAPEKDYEPRPNVFFPVDLAVRMADERNALAGITTAFHAIGFDNPKGGARSTEKAAEMIRTIKANGQKRLIDNRVHVRYEIVDIDSFDEVCTLLETGLIDLLSLMDHRPVAERYQPLNGADAATTLPVPERMQQFAAAAHAHHIPLASHDIDNAPHLELLRGLGAQICEFPLNLDTAHAARAAGMTIMVGAPNIVRGKSQMGALRALDAINAGVADILCADYVSQTLLPAIMKLPTISDLDLPAAVALGTRNPAVAVGLHDRGEITVGKRADLIAVSANVTYPHMLAVWSEGRAIVRTEPIMA